MAPLKNDAICYGKNSVSKMISLEHSMGQKAPILKLIMVSALMLLLAGLVMACGGTPVPTPEPRPTQDKGEVAVIPPPTPTTPASPTPPPAIIAPADSCVDCHSDQEKLIATADEEEVVEGLSEGEG
jgi:hypothetical protein